MASINRSTNALLHLQIQFLFLLFAFFSLFFFLGENVAVYHPDCQEIKHYSFSSWEPGQELALDCQPSLGIALIANNYFTWGHTSTRESLLPNTDQHRDIETPNLKSKELFQLFGFSNNSAGMVMLLSFTLCAILLPLPSFYWKFLINILHANLRLSAPP